MRNNEITDAAANRIFWMQTDDPQALKSADLDGTNPITHGEGSMAGINFAFVKSISIFEASVLLHRSVLYTYYRSAFT